MTQEAGARGRALSFAIGASALIVLGTGLRVLGYFGGIEFWWDEAMWAMRIARDQPASIRPLGYVWVSRVLMHLRNTEPVLRSVSLAAGVFSLPALVVVCRRAGLSRVTTLFGLFVLAVHPAAIDLTKEFKPYALELFLHLLLLGLAFSFLRSPQTRWLVAAGLVAAAAAPLSWSLSVLYPAVFTMLAVSSFRRGNPGHVLMTVGGVVATAGIFLTAYSIQLPQGTPEDHAFFGGGYDVFYVDPGIPGKLHWLLEKTSEIAAFPARLETFWLGRGVREVFAAFQVALCLLGVVAMGTSRRWDRAALWLSPWAITIGLNLLGWWPYGVFRTNLFLLAYSLLVGLSGLDGLRQWIAVRPQATRRRGRWLVPVFCSLVVLVFLPLDLGYFAEGKGSGMAGNCYVHHALEVIARTDRDEPAPERRRRFLLDPNASGVFSYYSDDHLAARGSSFSFFKERYRPSRRYQPLEEAVDRQAARGFWLLACKPGVAASIREYVLERCPQVDYLEDFRHGGVLLRCRGGGDRAPLGRADHESGPQHPLTALEKRP